MLYIQLLISVLAAVLPVLVALVVLAVLRVIFLAQPHPAAVQVVMVALEAQFM
jgi:hypothetical protein